jgi:cytochrome c
MRLMVLPILSGCLLGIVAAGQVRASDDDVKRGEELVQNNCAICHAIGLTGDSPHEEAPPFRQVMKVYPAASLTEALGEGLITGHPDMPEFVFPSEDVAAIVSYLKTLEPKP